MLRAKEGKPLTFWSKVYERELMEVVQAVQRWHQYLLGHRITSLTDQHSLKFFTQQRFNIEEQYKWASKLLGYDFEIQYKPGRENSVADVLSRSVTYAAISFLKFTDGEQWVEEVQKDAALQKVTQDLISNPNSHEYYYQLRGDKGDIQVFIKPINLHLAGVVYWEGMHKDIREFVANCEVWADISMDFINGLPKTKGKDTIMVVVVHLTKYAHFVALGHPLLLWKWLLCFYRKW
ncbi:Retrovirus-related Pol polyprotein from transposon 17.6, partial [Mucuna pruriens]